MGTKIKICGITDPEDARLAVELGAWALGLNFWPESVRTCPADAAEDIAASFKRSVELAGVFVNQTLDEIATAADRYELSLIQLHGDEGPAYCREVARRTGARVIKAARVRDAASVRDLEAFHTDFHLLDAAVPGQRGGTGQSFSWELAGTHRGAVPLILAGGLTPDNVGEAVRVASPYAVDTASGTEASPGHKDPARMTAFFRAVRTTEPEPSTA
ncbi:MAG TPA: phosphoribosylanthranilate isomerase [Thermoleophilaceae bacterium]|nr:phosphoribosylanthranilate isomerase [Thermoleophilaceae bacterium]